MLFKAKNFKTMKWILLRSKVSVLTGQYECDSDHAAQKVICVVACLCFHLSVCDWRYDREALPVCSSEMYI